MSCEFTYKLGRKCDKDRIENSEFCKKHKYTKKNKNEEDVPLVTPKKKESFLKRDSNFNVDGSDVILDNNTIILDGDIKNILGFNESNPLIEEHDEIIDVNTPLISKEDVDIATEAMHDPELMSEFLFSTMGCFTTLLEKMSQENSDRLGGYAFVGLTDDTYRKKNEYLRLLKYAYLENNEIIDEVMTPTRCIGIHLSTSLLQSFKKKDIQQE